MQRAAAVQGLTYILNETHGCSCADKSYRINSTKYTTYVLYSAANISVIASNAVGSSPPAIIPLPAESAVGLKSRHGA